MTIETTTNRTTPVSTNGSVTVFTFPFLIQASSHLLVYLVNTSTRVATLLTEDTDYEVAFTPGDAGGTVTMEVAYPSGSEVLMLRRVPFTQDTDIGNDSGWFPEVHENTFDYLTMQIQDLKDRLDHAFVIPTTEPGTAGGIEVAGLTSTELEGLSGADGATWLTGAGAPSAGLGNDGDFYLRTSNSAVYVKALGAWSVAIATLNGAPGSQISGYCGEIDFPAARTYTLELYAPTAGTIGALRTLMSAGTADVKLQINGVDVTGGVVAADNTEQTGTATAANTFAIGDTISLVVSAPSSAADLQFSVQVTL